MLSLQIRHWIMKWLLVDLNCVRGLFVSVWSVWWTDSCCDRMKWWQVNEWTYMNRHVTVVRCQYWTYWRSNPQTPVWHMVSPLLVFSWRILSRDRWTSHVLSVNTDSQPMTLPRVSGCVRALMPLMFLHSCLQMAFMHWSHCCRLRFRLRVWLQLWLNMWQDRASVRNWVTGWLLLSYYQIYQSVGLGARD